MLTRAFPTQAARAEADARRERLDLERTEAEAAARAESERLHAAKLEEDLARAAATEWKASGVKITNKSQLAEYLEDVRWGGTSSALMERVLYDRPKNVPAFMIELLAKGDVAPAGPDEMDDDTAAMKMQAMQRGRNARKERKEVLRDVLAMLKSTRNPQVEYLARVMKKWARENGINA